MDLLVLIHGPGFSKRQISTVKRWDRNYYRCQPGARWSLPRMLERIEAALATAGPAETRHLHQRAELIRELLTPRRGSPSLP